MTEENNYEVNFSKMNLSDGDILVLQVDINGLDENQAAEKLKKVREDEFVTYIESRGNKVIVSYTGINFNIMRLEENDKVIAYLDVTSLDENDESRYVEKFKNNLNNVFEDKLVCVPVRNGSPIIGTLNGENV